MRFGGLELGHENPNPAPSAMSVSPPIYVIGRFGIDSQERIARGLLRGRVGGEEVAVPIW